MQKLAARLGLDGQTLVMKGHVPRIDPFLAGAHALFVSSVFEGGPAVAVEALAHGVPVVSTDCSHFLHDIMTIPEAGRIVPSRDPQVLAAALAEWRAACALARASGAADRASGARSLRRCLSGVVRRAMVQDRRAAIGERA
jgi:glycosyltransferase involved in cell wall biosynthesis